MSDSSTIGMPASILLLEFGAQLHDAFGQVAYHVGSSVPGTKRDRPWRDVDVRLLLDDDEYLRYGDPEDPHRNRRWCTTVMVWAEHGRRLTGLPIDFQIQQVSWANAKYSAKDGHYRSALVAARMMTSKQG